jgi:hypothetical protein
MAAAIPGLDLLRETLLAPRVEGRACETRAEVARRREGLELRYGAEALLELRGRRTAAEGCQDDKHQWVVLGEAFGCVLCGKIKK